MRRVKGTRTSPPPGVPGLTLCRNDHPASRRSPHNVMPGSPGRHDEVSCSGYEAGRRRTIGVVAVLPTRARLASESGRRREARTALTAARRGWVAVRKAH